MTGITGASGFDAYQAAQNILKQKSAAVSKGESISSSGAGGASGDGFSNLVTNSAQEAVNIVKNAEQVSAAGITGKASVTEVVSAVNSADMALQTVVAIRDKAIGAYQDIIKMQI